MRFIKCVADCCRRVWKYWGKMNTDDNQMLLLYATGVTQDKSFNLELCVITCVQLQTFWLINEKNSYFP